MPDPELSPETNAAAMKILKNPKVLKGLSTPGRRFDRAGLLSELFDALAEHEGEDGQRALAKIMVAEYFAGKSGGIARQRILDSWCRLINWHSDDVHQVPVEEMTEEELIHAIDAALPKLRVIADTDEPLPPRPIPPPTPDVSEPQYLGSTAAGQELRQIRIEQGLSQSQLAERSGVHQAAISVFENGKQSMPLSKLEKVAAALGVELGDVKAGHFAVPRASIRRSESIEALDFTQLGFSSPEEEGEPEN